MIQKFSFYTLLMSLFISCNQISVSPYQQDDHKFNKNEFTCLIDGKPFSSFGIHNACFNGCKGIQISAIDSPDISNIMHISISEPKLGQNYLNQQNGDFISFVKNYDFDNVFDSRNSKINNFIKITFMNDSIFTGTFQLTLSNLKQSVLIQNGFFNVKLIK